ncbi:MAG: hypothetical protein JWM80_625 [Cyanobacteria bacterium RYN_339]|nr:hypothetical protein [Cyanobacteria bacterium RYN_339]
MLCSLVLAAALGAAPPPVSLTHLNRLRRELPAGHLAYWPRAAAPATPSGVNGPYRELPLPGAPVRLELVARAAVAYAQAGDVPRAREALVTVRAGARPDGSFAAELDAQGHPGAGTGTAWAVWAYGLVAHAVVGRDAALAATLRNDVARPVERLLFATVPTYRRYRPVPGGQAPRWFLGGSPADTALAVVGLAALYEDAPSPALKLLLRRYGDGLAEHRRGSPARFPFLAHMPDADGTAWRADQAWGLEALTRAGKALQDARFLKEAREEGDNLAAHLVLEGATPSSAADVLPLVRGLTALCGVTGESRYGKLAGLLAAPLQGTFDPANGRFDDRPGDVELAAGAPGTLAGLLALQAIAAQPRSWACASARALGAAIAPRRVEAEALPGVARVLDGGAGRRYVLLRPGELLRFGVHGAPGAYLAIPVAARRPGGPAALRVSAGGVTQSWLTTEAWEAGHFPRPVPLKGDDAVAVRCDEHARSAVELDALVLQPALAVRAFQMGDRVVWVARNYGSTPRVWRLGQDAFGLRPFQAMVIERAAGM